MDEGLRWGPKAKGEVVGKNARSVPPPLPRLSPRGLTAHQPVIDKVDVRGFAPAGGACYIYIYIYGGAASPTLGDLHAAAARITKTVYAAHADVFRGVSRLLSPLLARVPLFLWYS